MTSKKCDITALVGGFIRQARWDRGMTLGEVGDTAGVSVSLVSQIELGKSNASIPTLYKLLRALDKSFGELAHFIDKDHVREQWRLYYNPNRLVQGEARTRTLHTNRSDTGGRAVVSYTRSKGA